MDRDMVRFVRDNARTEEVQKLASLAEDFLRAFHNQDHWDFEHNGEAFALRTFAAWAPPGPVEVWDVGANRGHWALEAHRALPAARVTAFELVPDLAADLVELAARPEHAPWLRAVPCGLSSVSGTVTVTVSRTHDTTSAIDPRGWTEFFDGSEQVQASTTTGDEHLLAAGTGAPLLLKIDTEGHEADVLAGCSDLLARDDAPAMIQFEYGDTWVPAQASLAVVQPALEEHGYAVGRLHPDHVAFRTYARGDDHFRMGNMIAVRDPALREALAR